MLAPQPSEQVHAIQKLVPQKYLSTPALINVRDQLLEEIDADYECACRQIIG